MKIFAFLLGCISVVLAYVANPQGRLLEDFRRRDHIPYLDNDDGTYRIIDLKDTTLEAQAGLEDLTYYLYTKNNLESPIQITNNSIRTLETSGVFNAKRKNVFIIHGWLNNCNSPINKVLTEAILETHDVNLFVVDWGHIAHKNYFTARYSVKHLGRFVAEYINSMADVFNISYKDITLIGHSLGAHMTGIVGSFCTEKVDLIIGMDAALPMYFSDATEGRLDKTDADFVHVIHTNAGMLGFHEPIGHADYYPNGGTFQPGCFIDIVGGCAHGRGYEYLAESIKDSDREFGAYKCDEYWHFEDGACVSQDNRSLMGKLEVDRTARGSYYLDTNSKEPYAKDIVD